MSRPRLQLWLVLNGFPHSPPWYAGLLQQLLQQFELQLILVNNGQTYQLQPLAQQLEKLTGTTVQLQQHFLSLPLSGLLWEYREKLYDTPVLWLDDQSLLSAQTVKNGYTLLHQHPLMAPQFPLEPASTTFQQREQQQRALNLAASVALHAQTLNKLPPALLFQLSPTHPLWLWLQGQSDSLEVAIDSQSWGWSATPPMAPPLASQAVDLTLAAQLTTLPAAETVLQAQALLLRYPRSPQLYRHLGQHLLIAGQPAEAQVFLQTALQQGLLSPELLKLLATCQQALGQHQAAHQTATLLESRFGICLPDSPPKSHPSVAKPPTAPKLQLPQPARLSVCLIVKNEAAHLATCLQSVQPLQPELIVVDTGSSDSSREIAQHLGAQVFDQPWQNDFAHARNRSLAEASGDWVLVLDADEYLTHESCQALQQFLWDPPPGLPRCQLSIHNLTDNGEVGYVHSLVRLFPHHPGFAYQGRIHEQLVFHGETGSPLIDLPAITIQHTGYTQAMASQRQKSQRNLKLLHQALEDDPDNPDLFYYLGDSYRAAEQPAQALQWLQQALKGWQELRRWPPLACRTVFQVTSLLLENHPAQALAFLQTHSSQCDHLPDYFYWLGSGLLAQENHIAAMAAFENCLSFQGKNLQGFYTPELMAQAPLRNLVRLKHQQLCNSSDVERQHWAQRLQPDLLALLHFYPDGHWDPRQASLYRWLAEALLVLYPQSELARRFEACLPEALLSQPPAQLWLGVLQSLQPEPADTSSFNRGHWQLNAADLLSEYLPYSPEAFLRSGLEDFFWLGLLSTQRLDLALFLSGFYLQHQLPEPALLVLADSLAYFPEAVLLRHNYGMLLFQRGAYTQALAELEQVVQQAPDWQEALSNLQQMRNWLRQHPAT